MGASSVTGVGPGSAERQNKGSEHTTLGVGHLIGTRVVHAGTAVLGGGTPGTAVVTFPQQLEVSFMGNPNDSYCVSLTPQVTSSTAAPSSGVYAVYGLTTNGFTIVGPNGYTNTVHWQVFRI